MSYNIDTWKTKVLEGFEIPFLELMKIPCAEAEVLSHDQIFIGGISGGFRLVGKVIDSNIVVESITNYGEASGSSWLDFLAVLKQSKGKLVAVQIWERGDSITKLTVQDGIVNVDNIDL